VGVLTLERTERRYALSRRCLVGRGALADLRLADQLVSAEHATIYFDNGSWKVRDLGSRNGTFINRERLTSSLSRVLREGDRLHFGDSLGQPWVLSSAERPGPTAWSDQEGWIGPVQEALWIPTANSAEACISLRSGVWTFVDSSGVRNVSNEESITVGRSSWTLYLPKLDVEPFPSTETTRESRDERSIQLTLSASLDEEHIALTVAFGGVLMNLGGRTFNSALWALAKKRLEDEGQGIAEGEVGWMYSDELRQELGVERTALNLHLWRAIECFGKADLPGDKLIERRLATQQLRIGFACRLRQPAANPVRPVR
jgi:hypothetical protein